MSTIEEVSVCCGNCGRVSRQVRLMSFSTFEGPDLDYRPSQMLRSTMKYWIMVCPHCGYAAWDICKWSRVMPDTLRKIYEGADETLPPLADAFHKCALHSVHRRKIKEAIRAYLCAAWACDDFGDDAHARRMREQCLLLVGRKLRHCSKTERRSYVQLMADLLRRTGDFSGLLAIDMFDKRLDDETRNVLACQKTLAESHDFAAHCRDEFELET